MTSYITFSKNKSALDGIVHINPDGEFAFNNTYNICNSDDIAFLILQSKTPRSPSIHAQGRNSDSRER